MTIPARILVTLVFLTLCHPLLAQPRRQAAPARSGVDIVKLKSGKTIRGTVLRRDEEGTLTMVVPREWLQKTYPDLYAKTAQTEEFSQRAAWEQLKKRLDHELENPPESSRLSAFLEQERDRVEKLLNKPEAIAPRKFVWFEAPQKTIAKATPADPDARRTTFWAWSEGLDRAESRDANDLARELKAKGIDTAQPAPGLWDQVAPRPQDDREWGARMALAKYVLDEPLDYQGTGDVLVRSNLSRDMKDMAPLLTKMLSGQVQTLLKDLGGAQESAPRDRSAVKESWLKPAQNDAEGSNARAFRATRVDLDVDRRQAKVQSAFAVRLERGNWVTLWMDLIAEDATQPRPDLEARIMRDPNVKSALDTVKLLGLGGGGGGGGDDPIQMAIRFGGATMAAQQAIDERFFEFRDRYATRLDGPPLWWEN